jgi:hypothetical protein
MSENRSRETFLTITEYRKLIDADPMGFFRNDPELHACRPIPNPRRPNTIVFYSGSAAAIFPLMIGSKKIGIKLFSRKIPELAVRYAHIGPALNRLDSPHFARIEYREGPQQGATIGADHTPYLKMEWVEGVDLKAKVIELTQTRDATALQNLADQWRELALLMEREQIAHGNLNAEDLIIEPSGNIRLIDLDAMFVPSLRPFRLKCISYGIPGCQHPLKQVDEPYFDERLDRFPALALYVCLRALSDDPSLFQPEAVSESQILFTKEDSRDPNASVIFHRLSRSSNAEVRKLTDALAKAALGSYDQVPPFSAVAHAAHPIQGVSEDYPPLVLPSSSVPQSLPPSLETPAHESCSRGPGPAQTGHSRTGTYCQRISAKWGLPACVVFLIDQSGSMSDPLGGGPMTKAEAVARAVNKALERLIDECTRGEAVHDYYYVGVIGYGHDGAPDLLGEGAGPGGLLTASELEFRVQIEEVETDEVDHEGELKVEKRCKWLEPAAAGLTPTHEGFTKACARLRAWTEQFAHSFPPVVLHITDGEPNEPELADHAAQALREVRTSDGDVLLFNCGLAAWTATAIEYPAAAEGLPDDHAQRLFRWSSEIPENLIENAQVAGLSTVQRGSRGLVYEVSSRRTLAMFLRLGLLRTYRPAIL